MHIIQVVIRLRIMNLLSLLKITDILILNKEEAEMLVEKDIIPKEKDLLIGLHNLTKGIIVITDKNKSNYLL